MTLRMRPSVALPTGTLMGAPVFFTTWSRASPSVLSMAMVRTVFSPRSCATSRTRLSGWSPRLALLTRRAVYISGMAPGGNSTSTTGPRTWVIFPSVCAVALMAPGTFLVGYFSASAPETISINSLVIAACRVRL